MADQHGLRPLLVRVLADPRRENDPAAWNELLGRLRIVVRALFLVQVRQAADASDLAQEVQRRVLAGFERFRGDTVPALLAWIRTIAVSVLADFRRVRPDLTQSLPPDPPAPTGDSAFDSELTARVLRGVEELPEPRRRIVTAFYLEGRSCEEIARELNRSPVWVRVTKLHAVRQLRDRFREES